jgi:hypothetical protein
MDAVVKGRLAHWWVTHCENIHEWAQVGECVKVRIQPMIEFELMSWYKGIEYPHEHICFCENHWSTKNISNT